MKTREKSVINTKNFPAIIDKVIFTKYNNPKNKYINN